MYARVWLLLRLIEANAQAKRTKSDSELYGRSHQIENSLKLNETFALHARRWKHFSFLSSFCHFSSFRYSVSRFTIVEWRWRCCWHLSTQRVDLCRSVCECVCHSLKSIPICFRRKSIIRSRSFLWFASSSLPLFLFLIPFRFFRFAHHCHRSQFIKICCFWSGTSRYFYFGYKYRTTHAWQRLASSGSSLAKMERQPVPSSHLDTYIFQIVITG